MNTSPHDAAASHELVLTRLIHVPRDKLFRCYSRDPGQRFTLMADTISR